MKKLLLSMLLALLSFGAFAGGTTTTTLSKVYTDATGYYAFYVSNPITGGPSCAKQTGRFILDPSTAMGNRQLAMLITAMFSGKTVQFYGTGTCSLVGDTETLNSFFVNN